jgi:hypothetical protein
MDLILNKKLDKILHFSWKQLYNSTILRVIFIIIFYK